MIMVEDFEVEGPRSLTNDDEFYLLRFNQKCAGNSADKKKDSEYLIWLWKAKPHNLSLPEVLSLISSTHTFGVKYNKTTYQVLIYVFSAHHLTMEEMYTIICEEKQTFYTVVATGQYTCRVGHYVKQIKYLGYARPHYPGERKHDTISNYDFAYEGSNTYYYGLEELSAPVIPNAWPEQVVNASILPYLIPEQPREANEKFSEFVKTWYQYSCAIVYFSPNNDAKIISTGTLVVPGRIVTARHNFIYTFGTGIGRPYLRFFKYSVFPTKQKDRIRVLEQYLDVPSCGTQDNEAYGLKIGLDAIYLRICALKDNALFYEYAKILPTVRNRADWPIARGNYAMFHFSCGKPQITAGKISETLLGRKLHEGIIIQNGMAASGATVIWQSAHGSLGGGISISRILSDGQEERRIISFSEFHTPTWIDNICAPYYYNKDFYIFSPQALKEEGFNFLRERYESIDWRLAILAKADTPRRCYYLPWNPAVHTGLAKRQGLDEKPDDDSYRVNDHHSNHHIIPKDDLLYLYNYLHALDFNTRSLINRKVEELAQRERQIKIMALDQIIKDYHPNDDRNMRWREGVLGINTEIETFKKDKFEELKSSKIAKRYGEFLAIMAFLCQPLPLQERNFVWAKWNLFKGWKSDYRQDDPEPYKSGNFYDLSEKTRPAKFCGTLWNCLKDRDTGLYHRIRDLKKLKDSGVSYEAKIKDSENALLSSLRRLQSIWQERSFVMRQIHPYHSEEWILTGYQAGHDVYKLKS